MENYDSDDDEGDNSWMIGIKNEDKVASPLEGRCYECTYNWLSQISYTVSKNL